MNLLNCEYNYELKIDEEYINVLVIENQECMLKTAESILNETYGKGEDFVLSEEGGKILEFKNNVYYAFNIFDLSINNRQILTKLYKQLFDISDDFFGEDLNKIKNEIFVYLDNLFLKMNHKLIYNFDINPIEIFKLMDLKFDEDANMLNRIHSFIEVLSDLCDYKLIIFNNLKQYFKENDLKMIYQCAIYHKIQLLLIENKQYDIINKEKTTIIDKDLAVIYC